MVLDELVPLETVGQEVHRVEQVPLDQQDSLGHQVKWDHLDQLVQRVSKVHLENPEEEGKMALQDLQDQLVAQDLLDQEGQQVHLVKLVHRATLGPVDQQVNKVRQEHLVQMDHWVPLGHLGHQVPVDQVDNLEIEGTEGQQELLAPQVQVARLVHLDLEAIQDLKALLDKLVLQDHLAQLDRVDQLDLLDPQALMVHLAKEDQMAKQDSQEAWVQQVARGLLVQVVALAISVM